MTTTLLAGVAEEAPLDAVERAPQPSLPAPPALLSGWLAPPPRAAWSTRELASVLIASAVLHAGVATAAYRQEKATPSKPISRVEIEVARPPERPKPTPAVVPPPPPPKPAKAEPRPLAAKPEQAEPTPLAAPPDTGSSAPSDVDGELHAGSGGLGVEPPAPPAPPVPVAPPAAPAPVVQAREGANYLANPRPAYPRQAKREGLEGTTLLRIWVQPSGKPGAVNVQRSSGHELLDSAAKEAVSKWTFVPATQGGVPVGGFVTVPIVFRLQ